MSSETNNYYEHIDFFERLNSNNSKANDPKLSTRDEICKSCTPKRFCENCLRNGILLSSFICDSDDKKTIAQKATEPNLQPKFTNIYEYNLHLLAAICVLEDEKIVYEPKYRFPDIIAEYQCPFEMQQAITKSVALNTRISHTSNDNNISPDGMLYSEDGFGIFSQSKNRKLEMYRAIESFQEKRDRSFSYANEFCLSSNEDIIVVDKNNHRIKVFDQCGLFKLGFGEFGKRNGQLFYPHQVEALPDERIIVCDMDTRLQIFDCFGNFEKVVLYIDNGDPLVSFTITYDRKIVALSKSSTVLIVTEHNEIVQRFCCRDFVSHASHIVTNGHYIYICDFLGHGVVVFDRYGNCQRKIGNFKETPYPIGIDAICSNGTILVSCCRHNSYVINSFTATGMFISKFTWPNRMHASGLKVTKSGLFITLDIYNNSAVTMKAIPTNNLVSSG